MKSTRSKKAFTLVELLVVIAIMGLLMGLAVPGIGGALKGNKLSSAGELLRSQLSLAQQTAMRENNPIQVRFYSYDDPNVPGGEQKYKAYQFFRRRALDLSSREIGNAAGGQIGDSMEEISPMRSLPDPIIFSDSQRLSTLLSLPRQRGAIPWKRRDTLQVEYVAFDFRADGSTNLSGSTKWFITLFESNKERGSDIPKNFATVQVDPFTGSVRMIRP